MTQNEAEVFQYLKSTKIKVEKINIIGQTTYLEVVGFHTANENQ